MSCRIKNLLVIPHISFLQATLLETFETSKMSLLKFDSLPGTDVLTYLAEKATYTEQIVSEITCQLLDALSYVHWRGKVYLNLEPGNIIVCSGRSLGKTVQVKLVNFEVAQTVSKSGTQIKGTYNFDYAGATE
jgi:serine/threonine protein kinase